MERRTRPTELAWGCIALQCVHPSSGTPLGLHCKAMHGLGGLPPPFCIAWGLGGFARAVLHRFAMHGQRPPSKAMQHPPCNALGQGPCPREAYGMQVTGLGPRGAKRCNTSNAGSTRCSTERFETGGLSLFYSICF